MAAAEAARHYHIAVGVEGQSVTLKVVVTTAPHLHGLRPLPRRVQAGHHQVTIARAAEDKGSHT